MDNKIILGSLALDLKRAALGLNRGSFKFAQRFLTEALKRKKEAKNTKLPPYLSRLLDRVDESLQNNEVTKKAEDALMYSTLIQNYILYKF